jgi:hypothetical protein
MGYDSGDGRFFDLRANKRILMVFACAALAVSCRTLPAGAGRAATPEELTPQWAPFAEDAAGGLAFFAGAVRDPRLEVWALRADLGAPGRRVVVSGSGAREGALREGHIPSTTVSRFAERYGCLAGINANPFSPVSGKIGEDRVIDGIVVADGAVIARPNPAFDALVFYDASGDEAPGAIRAAIVSQAEIASLEGIRNAVGGFSIVLRDGKTAERLLSPEATPQAAAAARHPRSAAGLSADGRYLYLLAVDGRRFGSVGATEAELAVILRRLGAADGLNFDGGGSTSLALRFPDGKARPVNTPIHKQIPGWERGVSACLGLR